MTQITQHSHSSALHFVHSTTVTTPHLHELLKQLHEENQKVHSITVIEHHHDHAVLLVVHGHLNHN